MNGTLLMKEVEKMRKTSRGTGTRPGRYIKVILLLALFSLSIFIGGCGLNSRTENLPAERSQTQLSGDSASAPMSENEKASDTLSLERKVVQNANLKLKVTDVAAAVDKIILLCGEKGGYTVSSRTYRENDKLAGQLAVKVPQASLLEVLASIAGYGEVSEKVITARDVTEEYYDAQARLKVLQSKEARLLGLMDKAVSIAEIISVENELSKTRSEIEVLSGRLQLLANATEYSLISINLAEGVPGTVKAPQGTLGKAWQGLVDSLNEVMELASGTVILLFAALPWLIILAAFFVAWRWGYKRVKRQRESRQTPGRPE